MKGTEKQIKWAEDIIADAYKTIEVNIDLVNKDIENKPWLAKDLKLQKAAFEKVRSIIDKFVSAFGDDASKIIEKRNVLSGMSILDTVRGMVADQKRKMEGTKKC